MFFLTSERQKVFDAAHIYPFGETFDATFEVDLYEELTAYIDVIPQIFQSEVIERTLFQNAPLRKQFEEWCKVTIELYTVKQDTIHKESEVIIESFHPSAQTVFSQSFHDGEILNAEQQGRNFVLLLDMSGGFTDESMVELTFYDVKLEGKIESYYIYDELRIYEDRFALRVLTSAGSPYDEWTISFRDVTAKYLYRPAVYIEPGEIATWDDYVMELNRDDKYYIVKDMQFVQIELDSLSQMEKGIFAGEMFLGASFEEAKEQIYCASYEDPYAHFSEPIPIDELPSALFDVDQNIRVRAFNTIFSLGEDVAGIVNDALRKANVNTEEDMYFSIMASHFDELDCLDHDVKIKWLGD